MLGEKLGRDEVSSNKKELLCTKEPNSKISLENQSDLFYLFHWGKVSVNTFHG